MRRASTIGMMKLYGDFSSRPSASLEMTSYTSLEMTSCTSLEMTSRASLETEACATRVSNVPTASSGFPLPKQSPLAVDTPTLRPVYEPGPMLTHTASQSDRVRPRSESISWMNTAVSEVCAFGAELSRYAVTDPPSASATEQRAVEVSMSMILSMISYLASVRRSFRYGKTS